MNSKTQLKRAKEQANAWEGPHSQPSSYQSWITIYWGMEVNQKKKKTCDNIDDRDPFDDNNKHSAHTNQKNLPLECRNGTSAFQTITIIRRQSLLTITTIKQFHPNKVVAIKLDVNIT